MPLFASIEEQSVADEEGRILQKHYLDADFSQSPERIKKMAANIVERLYLQTDANPSAVRGKHERSQTSTSQLVEKLRAKRAS